MIAKSPPRATRSAVPALIAALTLAACSRPGDTDVDRAATPNATATPADETRADPTPAPSPSPTPSPPSGDGRTIGGDGSAIRLSVLSGDDITAAKLEGELACAFSGRDGTLLHAAGDVASAERAQGIVKVLDSVETVSAPGGFNGIAKGGTFAGRGKTVRVALAGTAPGKGGESPASPATLTYERADGASRAYPGTWTCGP